MAAAKPTRRKPAAKKPARRKPARKGPAGKKSAAAGKRALGRAWAERLVKQVERVFAARDIPAIMKGYTDDVVVRFGATPELRGKPAVERWLRERLGTYQSYTLKKTLKTVVGDTVGVVWQSAWTDAGTGKPMRGRGAEFWTMRGGKCALWEAALSAWEDEGGR